MIKINIGIYKRFSCEHIDSWNYNNTLDINIKFKLIPNLSFEIKKSTGSNICHIIFRIEWLFWHIPISIFFKLNK